MVQAWSFTTKDKRRSIRFISENGNYNIVYIETAVWTVQLEENWPTTKPQNLNQPEQAQEYLQKKTREKI